MAEHRLHLLGGFERLAEDGRALDLSAGKARALIAFVALQAGKSASRERLATLLWPESDGPRAGRSLRRSLTTLRRVLPARARVLPVDPERVEPAVDRIRVDALEFEAEPLCRSDFVVGRARVVGTRRQERANPVLAGYGMSHAIR
jgi:DNA-binding SARP family transcriptional activator